LRRIRWLTEAGGTQVAGGEGWSAVVRACSAGGYEAQITTGDRVEFYPGVGASPRTAELCKAWVRLRVQAAANRRRWLAYLGRPSPKERGRQSFVHHGRPQARGQT
jgi:hypothetical protein